jgi:hypothetical protein
MQQALTFELELEPHIAWFYVPFVHCGKPPR